MQGKFWEMWNLLYTNQNSWNNLGIDQRDKQFEAYAGDLKLDIDKFRSDVASDNVSKKITFDQALGKNAGVDATPTFFINGEKLDAETSSGIVQGDLTKIKEKLDELLK